MGKFTTEDVLAVDPGLSAAEVEEALAELNAEPGSLEEAWEGDARDIVRAVTEPLKIGRDGLTGAMRAINADAAAQGLPIPFPPKE